MIRDLLGDRKTDEILSELQSLAEDIQTLGWKELRPWSEFFGNFKAPEFTSKILEERVVTNLLYYRSNYVVLCFGILCLQILFSPIILLSFFLVFGVFAYLCHFHRSVLQIGDFKFDNTGKQYIAIGISAFVLIVTGTITSLLWTLIYSLFLCGLHLLFRPRNISSKANKVYEEMKLNGNDTVFQFMSAANKGGNSKSEYKSEDPEADGSFKNGADRNYYQEEKAQGMRKRI